MSKQGHQNDAIFKIFTFNKLMFYTRNIYNVMQSCCSQAPGSKKNNNSLHLLSAYYMLLKALFISYII